MGTTCFNSTLVNSSKRHLTVATLNYGGILNSPFQFFSNQGIVEQQQISKIFHQLLPIYFPKNTKQIQQKTFKWDVGKIDQKLQIQRYSPIYNRKAGIIKGMLRQKFVQSNSFKQQWQNAYQKNKHKIQPPATQQQIQAMKLFDLICYHTLLAHTYKGLKKQTLQRQLKLEQMNINGKKLALQPYNQLMNRFFERSYLDEQKKISKVLSALKQNHADVIFFQQPTQKLIQKLKIDQNYITVENGKQLSMILIKKSSFLQTSQKLIQQRSQINKYKNNSIDINIHAIQDYIFGSVHLSSKKQKAEKQVSQLKSVMNQLHSKYSSNFHIIIGGDTNRFVDNDGIKKFDFYPTHEKQYTNRKKRTYLQPQFHKAMEQNKECKDQIFSSLQINKKRSKICMINNKTADEKDLLPTDKHPFDHFMVIVSINRSD